MFIEIRGCGRNWLKLLQSLELFILLILYRGNLPQFLWGQEIGVFLKKRSFFNPSKIGGILKPILVIFEKKSEAAAGK